LARYRRQLSWDGAPAMTGQQQQDIAILLRRAQRTLAVLADLGSLFQLRADEGVTVAARVRPRSRTFAPFLRWSM
jgi:hypothetical protein